MKYIHLGIRRYNEETKFLCYSEFRAHALIRQYLSDECVSTKLGVTENFVSSLYLLIQSSTLKKCIEHCLTALATLLHVYTLEYNNSATYRIVQWNEFRCFVVVVSLK